MEVASATAIASLMAETPKAPQKNNVKFGVDHIAEGEGSDDGDRSQSVSKSGLNESKNSSDERYTQ